MRTRSGFFHEHARELFFARVVEFASEMKRVSNEQFNADGALIEGGRA